MRRTSDKKSSLSDKAEEPVAEDHPANTDHQPEPAADRDETDEQETLRRSDQDATKARRRKQRELRRKSKEVTRTRSTGLGLSISGDAAPSSKRKIVFDDNAADDDEHDIVNRINVNDKDRETDSDDDVVEEIQSNVARAKALDQRAEELEVVEMSITRPRRKKSRTAEQEKKGVESKDNEDDEFDEHFFAQVDSEVAEARQAKKLGLEHTGKHTTFVAADDQAKMANPFEADHNIELVVLGDGSLGSPDALRQQASADDTLGIAPTKASILFGGKMLPNGNDVGKAKGNKKKQTSESGWKRSKKASALVVSRSRAKRRKGGGGPAARFVVK